MEQFTNKQEDLLKERELNIYKQYQEVIAPFIVELEVRDTAYPIEIFNEIRSIFTHLSRYKLQNSEDDIRSAENHIKRAILDCFKYLCISISEKVNSFRREYKKVDLGLADNGRFLPELNRLENIAKTSFIEAKKAEIKKAKTEELYTLYEKAYNDYSALDEFLDNSQEAILFASTQTKRKEYWTIISTVVTIISIILAVAAWI